MSTVLQTRFMVVEQVHQLATNIPRKKKDECLLTDFRAQQVVRTLMIQRFPYYQFCNKCLNSSDNVMHHQKRAAANPIMQKGAAANPIMQNRAAANPIMQKR